MHDGSKTGVFDGAHYLLYGWTNAIPYSRIGHLNQKQGTYVKAFIFMFDVLLLSPPPKKKCCPKNPVFPEFRVCLFPEGGMLQQYVSVPTVFFPSLLQEMFPAFPDFCCFFSTTRREKSASMPLREEWP